MCVFELIHFLLPTAVCCFLVLHPPKFVLDRVSAAVEEEQSALRTFADAFRTLGQKEQIDWLTFYYWRISYGALIWDEKQLKISFLKTNLGYNRTNMWRTRIHIFDALQMWSPQSPWTPQLVEFLSPERGGKVKAERLFLTPKGCRRFTNSVWSEMQPHLQSDVAFKCRLALQILISTATRASLKWDTSRHVGIFHFSRVLLLYIHQLLHGLTHALCPHLLECHYYVTSSILSLHHISESRRIAFDVRKPNRVPTFCGTLFWWIWNL